MREPPGLGPSPIAGTGPATQGHAVSGGHTAQGGAQAASSRRSGLRSLSYDEQVQALTAEGGPPAPGAQEPRPPSGPLDEMSLERWIQSALNLLLGAGLSVDGVLRGPTIPAVGELKAEIAKAAAKKATGAERRGGRCSSGL